VQNIDDTFTWTLKDGVEINFDEDGLQTAVVDRNGNTTDYAYDQNGNLTSITDVYGLVTEFGYSGGVIVSITDPADRVTALDYDTGRLVSITAPDPDGAGSLAAPVTEYAYDSDHRLTEWIDPLTNATTVDYDFAGRVTTITRPDDSQENFTASQVIGLVALGNGTEQDPAVATLLEDADAVYEDALGNTWNTQLDMIGYGLPIIATDPLDNVTMTYRDDDGLPGRVTDALGLITEYDYDTGGNPITVTRADGSVYAYQYNAFGQVTQITEPDPDGAGGRAASVWVFIYDSAGNLTDRVLPDDDTNSSNNPSYVYSNRSQSPT